MGARGEKARVPAVWAVGIALSTAQIEGFIANAELLSCAAGAVALAGILIAVWERGAPDLRMLFLAGLAGVQPSRSSRAGSTPLSRGALPCSSRP